MNTALETIVATDEFKSVMEAFAALTDADRAAIVCRHLYAVAIGMKNFHAEIPVVHELPPAMMIPAPVEDEPSEPPSEDDEG